jgi:Arm DNA-binding domain
MPLTDTAIRNAKPGEKPVRLFDERGLYLEVSPTGGKWWRLKYRFDGKGKRLSVGVYPDVSLKDARDLGTHCASCWPMESTPATTVRR